MRRLKEASNMKNVSTKKGKKRNLEEIENIS